MADARNPMKRQKSERDLKIPNVDTDTKEKLLAKASKLKNRLYKWENYHEDIGRAEYKYLQDPTDAKKDKLRDALIAALKHTQLYSSLRQQHQAEVFGMCDQYDIQLPAEYKRPLPLPTVDSSAASKQSASRSSPPLVTLYDTSNDLIKELAKSAALPQQMRDAKDKEQFANAALSAAMNGVAAASVPTTTPIPAAHVPGLAAMGDLVKNAVAAGVAAGVTTHVAAAANAAVGATLKMNSGTNAASSPAPIVADDVLPATPATATKKDASDAKASTTLANTASSSTAAITSLTAPTTPDPDPVKAAEAELKKVARDAYISAVVNNADNKSVMAALEKLEASAQQFKRSPRRTPGVDPHTDSKQASEQSKTAQPSVLPKPKTPSFWCCGCCPTENDPAGQPLLNPVARQTMS